MKESKKYYFISCRINIPGSTPEYHQELTEQTPLEYVIYWKDIGGHYGDRSILYAQEISEKEYHEYKLSVNS